MLCCIDCCEIRLSLGRFFRDIQCCKIVLNSGRILLHIDCCQIVTAGCMSVYWLLIVFVVAAGSVQQGVSVLSGYLSR